MARNGYPPDPVWWKLRELSEKKPTLRRPSPLHCVSKASSLDTEARHTQTPFLLHSPFTRFLCHALTRLPACPALHTQQGSTRTAKAPKSAVMLSPASTKQHPRFLSPFSYCPLFEIFASAVDGLVYVLRDITENSCIPPQDEQQHDLLASPQRTNTPPFFVK